MHGSGTVCCHPNVGKGDSIPSGKGRVAEVLFEGDEAPEHPPQRPGPPFPQSLGDPTVSSNCKEGAKEPGVASRPPI